MDEPESAPIVSIQNLKILNLFYLRNFKMKSTTYFFLLFCTVLVISGCVNTQSKDVAIKDQNIEDDLNIHTMSLVKPNLTGTWVLNKELSQNPQEQLKKSMRQSSRGKSKSNKSMNGRGSGEHRGKGNGGRRGDGYTRNNKKNNLRHGFLPQSFQALLKASETIELRHDEPLLTMITKDGQEEVYTDFRSTSVSSSGDLNQKITIAGWENNVLVVENTLNVGRFIQHFNLNSTSGKLWVKTLIITSHIAKPVQFNRVYERLKTEK